MNESARRVAHAAETIRARWEIGVSTDPQTEAAQALEDTCQLQSPETAAEMADLREMYATQSLANAEYRLRVDALVAERASTNAALSAAVEEIAELKAQRERRRIRLVALQNDALNMRGTLSPAGCPRRVPMELGETLTPVVEWLLDRVAELETLLPEPSGHCPATAGDDQNRRHHWDVTGEGVACSDCEVLFEDGDPDAYVQQKLTIATAPLLEGLDVDASRDVAVAESQTRIAELRRALSFGEPGGAS